MWDPHARGVFFGLSLKTTRREMNRAVLEGCAYGLRQLIEMVEQVTGQKLTRFSSIGGGAKSRVWAQIKADITGRDITVLDMNDMALWVRLCWPVWASACSKTCTRPPPRWRRVCSMEIQHSDAHKEVYDRRYQVYTGLYPSVKDLYKGEPRRSVMKPKHKTIKKE